MFFKYSGQFGPEERQAGAWTNWRPPACGRYPWAAPTTKGRFRNPGNGPSF